MTDPQISTLQRWIAGKGNRAATELGKLLSSIGCDPDALIRAVESEQIAVEAEELMQSFLRLAERGLDVEAASAAVAQVAKQRSEAESPEAESAEAESGK